MQNQLKHLNEEVLPQAFQMLEDGKTIAEVRIAFGDSLDPKMKNLFLNRLNFYVKNVFREKYSVLKNVLLVLFSLFFVLMVYMRISDYLSRPEVYSTLNIILNLLLILFFGNIIWKLTKWQGSYIRSVIVFSIIFSIGDLIELSDNLNNVVFLFRFALQISCGLIALYLYRKIFPSHGFMGAPKEMIKEKDILDDFR